VQTLPPSVPQQVKDGLVQAFSHISGGLEVGAGQAGVNLDKVPAQFRQIVGATAKAIFDEGFTNAMRTTLWLPIAVMGLAALSILFVSHGGRGTVSPAPEPERTGTQAEVPAQTRT